MIAFSLSYGQKRSFAVRSNVTGNFKPRLLNITELNAGIGYYVLDRDYTKRFINMTSVLGAGLAKNLTGGIGAGVSLYDAGTLFPLFADFRYFFHLAKTRFFLLGEGGILLNSANTEGGTKYFISPGVGVILPVSNSLSINLGS